MIDINTNIKDITFSNLIKDKNVKSLIIRDCFFYHSIKIDFFEGKNE